ncbi:hypothetical protein OIC43_36895 [Streptomyces sp. NBC_00825]|uniref:hypothetical protein n=1 Tax=unclassified Streptomyces TaxID=2593676 RepID=UPI002ED50D62|nr:hypothetical protein OG832_06795 [Streptomyces sp. NBC_00826]WTH94216.1 hypothetical protein OIC43_36895 [Streptomyces sp. NBC_00825]WTI02951.1 hypothetical protein OHA23_36875 [Streptomyces sp. NBC_00822]
MTRYWHGGVPGLAPGDLVEPHPPAVVDDCPICTARANGQTYTDEHGRVIDPPTGRPDRVYITTDREYARFYASKVWLGDLYVVEPAGEIQKSTEDPFPTWTCESARVLSVYSRAVRLTPGQRQTLANRWGRADMASALRALGGGR